MQVGVGALTFQEMRAHFALWALLKSPLMLGADLSTLSVDQLELVSNREIIAVNQDELGVPGGQVWREGPYEVGILNSPEYPTAMEWYLLTDPRVEPCCLGPWGKRGAATKRIFPDPQSQQKNSKILRPTFSAEPIGHKQYNPEPNV